MRVAEVAGRAGKQPDGSAQTREAKLVTVWTAESRDEEDKPVRDLGIDYLFGGDRKRRCFPTYEHPTGPTLPSAYYARSHAPRLYRSFTPPRGTG